MATPPPALAGKPKDEYLHARKERNVQVSFPSPMTKTTETEGLPQETHLDDERIHHLRSYRLNTPLTSLSIEAATSPASVDDASLHPPAAEDTPHDPNDPLESTSPPALPSKAVETDQRDRPLGGTTVLPPNRRLAKDDGIPASSETQATVPVSGRKQAAQATNLSAQATNDTDGVLLSGDVATGATSSTADDITRTDRERATDDSHGASSVREATMPPSIPRIAATAPGDVGPTGITPGVMSGGRATDDNHVASSVGEATVPLSIPRTATDITPGVLLADEEDAGILFL